MKKAFAIWLMAGLPLLADSVAATRAWVSNRVAEARAEWRGDVASATNPVPGWISAAEGRMDGRLGAATNAVMDRVAAAADGLSGQIASSTNGVMGEVNAATGSLWTAIGSIEGVTADIGAFVRTNDLPTKVSQLENDAGYLTNHVDVSGFALAAGVFPDWSSKGTWREGEFCTWKGVVYRFTGAGDPSAVPDISPASWAASDVGTAIAEARPDMSSLTNPVPSWIAAATNGLPEKIAAATNGLPERIAVVTNGLPELIAASTNGIPEAVADATNGLPEMVVASTNPVPAWIASATNGIPALIDSSVRAQVAGLDSKAATRLMSVDGSRWIDGTGAVWQVAQRAVWDGSQADAPLGETSFAGDGWGLAWTDDGTGVTGSWDLYRTLSMNGPLVAHFTAGGLPYQEGVPVPLSLLECTVGGVEAVVGQKTDQGWYQIADSAGAQHFVSPLVTTATVVRVTNYVDRLALSGEAFAPEAVAAIVTNEVAAATNAVLRSALGADITTNDVCAIVTNEVELGYTEWELHGIPDDFGMERYGVANPVYTVFFDPLGGGVAFLRHDGESDQDVYADVDDPDATFLQFYNGTGIGGERDITATREDRGTRNVLGLMRLTDLATVTNGIGPVRAGADTIIAKDVSVSVGLDADSSAMEQNQSPHNGWKRGVAVGYEASSGAAGVAVGSNASSSNGVGAVAIGLNSCATNLNSVSIGNQSGRTEPDDPAFLGSPSVGKYSVAVGYNANGGADSSVALGSLAAVDPIGGGSVAIGQRASVNRQNAIAVGVASSSSRAPHSVALGSRATAKCESASLTDNFNSGIAVGTRSLSLGASSIAIGGANGYSSSAVGKSAYGDDGGTDGRDNYSGAEASNEHSTAIGAGALASGSRGIAIGRYSAAVYGNAIAIGSVPKTNEKTYHTRATKFGAIAIGTGARALNTASIALGSISGNNNSDAAVASGSGAVQIGPGTNSAASTFQVWGHRMLDRSTGKIPAERIPDSIFSAGNGAFAAAAAAIVSQAVAEVTRLGDWEWTSSKGYIQVPDRSYLPGSDDGNGYFMLSGNPTYISGDALWDVSYMLFVYTWDEENNQWLEYRDEWKSSIGLGPDADTVEFFADVSSFGTFTARRKNAHGLARLEDLESLPVGGLTAGTNPRASANGRSPVAFGQNSTAGDGPLKGQVFDFSTMQKVMNAVKSCVEALGGTVTNMPQATVN